MAVEESHYIAIPGICLIFIVYNVCSTVRIYYTKETVAKTKLFVLAAEHLCLFKNTRSEQLEGVLI